MAFSNIENSEKLKIIDVAIVDNAEIETNNVFKEAFKVLSDKENEERLFETKYVTEEAAKELLKNDEISGYIVLSEVAPKVIVQANGINETIIKFTVEEIMQQEEIIKNIAKQEIGKYVQNTPTGELGNYDSLYTEVYTKVIEKAKEGYSNIEDISSSNLSYTMIEFYTLIAMTCLYGGVLGMTAINQRLANMSNNGKRVAISPVKKGKLILSSSLASYIIQLVGIMLLFIYTIFVLKVDYGEKLELIILLTLVRMLCRVIIWNMCRNSIQV